MGAPPGPGCPTAATPQQGCTSPHTSQPGKALGRRGRNCQRARPSPPRHPTPRCPRQSGTRTSGCAHFPPRFTCSLRGRCFFCRQLSKTPTPGGGSKRFVLRSQKCFISPQGRCAGTIHRHSMRHMTPCACSPYCSLVISQSTCLGSLRCVRHGHSKFGPVRAELVTRGWHALPQICAPAGQGKSGVAFQ